MRVHPYERMLESVRPRGTVRERVEMFATGALFGACITALLWATIG